MVAVGAIGCRDTRAWRTVTGRVILTTGEPVRDATIKFIPESGPWPRARLDDQGCFELVSYRGGSRVRYGEYRVVIAQVLTVAESSGPGAVHPQYTTPETTTLTITIDAKTADSLEIVVDPAPSDE